MPNAELFDTKANLISVLHDNDNPRYLVHKKPIFISNQQDRTIFPEDLSILKHVGYIGGGSGGVYLLKDVQGNQDAFKAHDDINHLHEEMISDALYQTVGCAVPDFATL